MLAMNKLSIAHRAQVLGLLVEGNSINATCRITGVAKATVLKLLADVGKACAEYQDKTLRNLPALKSGMSQPSYREPSASVTYGRGPASAPIQSS